MRESTNASGLAISEAELVRFGWWVYLWRKKYITLEELQTLFGRKLISGLIKPLSRGAVYNRLDLLKKRGITIKENMVTDHKASAS